MFLEIHVRIRNILVMLLNCCLSNLYKEKSFYQFTEVPALKAVQESTDHLLTQSNRLNVHGPSVYNSIAYGP